MRAMVLHAQAAIEQNPLHLEDVPIPRPRPGEVLVEVEVCAICRTDLHVIEGDLPPAKTPVIPGHQVIGRGVDVGERVSRFVVGDRVGIAWLRHVDGTCRFCRHGRENLCPDARFTGYMADGGYAEYAVVPADFAYPIPEELDSAHASPLLCAGIIGYHALRRSDLEPGQRLGIYGFGSSAHLVIQIAHHWGCDVYVATRGERHRSLARELGAVWVGDARDTPPVKVDSAIIFAPVGDLVPRALEALDRGGTLALAGIYMTEVPALNYERDLFYERTVRSVTANTRRDGLELLQLGAEIPIVTEIETFPLAGANDALQKLKHDGIQGSGVLTVR